MLKQSRIFILLLLITSFSYIYSGTANFYFVGCGSNSDNSKNWQDEAFDTQGNLNLTLSDVSTGATQTGTTYDQAYMQNSPASFTFDSSHTYKIQVNSASCGSDASEGVTFNLNTLNDASQSSYFIISCAPHSGELCYDYVQFALYSVPAESVQEAAAANVEQIALSCTCQPGVLGTYGITMISDCTDAASDCNTSSLAVKAQRPQKSSGKNSRSQVAQSPKGTAQTQRAPASRSARKKR